MINERRFRFNQGGHCVKIELYMDRGKDTEKVNNMIILLQSQIILLLGLIDMIQILSLMSNV